MKNEIEIPEGHEAKIVENKIVIESKENDDERIRRELIEFLRCSFYVQDSDLEYKKIEEWVTWLEKQKEEAQKQFNLGIQAGKEEVLYEMDREYYSPLCKTIKDKIREYIANHFITAAVVKTDVRSIVKAMEEGVRLGIEEQKPLSTEETELNSMAFLVQLGYICIPPGAKPESTEWSEEDKENIEVIATHLDNLGNTAMAEILRNLCPQSK